MEHVEQQPTNVELSPPPMRYDPNNAEEVSERMRYQYSIIFALTKYLKWRDKTFNTDAFLTCIFGEDKNNKHSPDSPGARLHDLTQSTDEDTIEKIGAFIEECKTLSENEEEKGENKESQAPVTVPEALRFLLLEGGVVEQTRTLH